MDYFSRYNRRFQLPRGRSLNRFFSWVVVWFMAVLMMSACAKVEFDKMAGTQFPAAQMVAGEEVSHTTIYRDAGIPVVVDENENGITPLICSRRRMSWAIRSGCTMPTATSRISTLPL
jgi:hypothetical protein